MPTRAPLLLALLALAACGGGPAPDAGDSADSGDVGASPGDPASATDDRPLTRADTLMLEGMPEPITLRLFRAPEDFPLPFAAYVPEDMAAEPSVAEDGASVRFVAEFGGVRSERAFVHLFVHPAGTDPQQALAVVRAYQAADGIPVSRGIEPLGNADAARRMPWADQAYAIRYQGSGSWHLGTVGIGTHAGRVFHILTHYPAEYGDGFAPRASMILDTWRWADGQPLEDGGGGADITIPSARTDSAR